MLVTCWSVKGGSGTTVVSAAMAIAWARLAPHGALLVDLAGDVPLALGVSADEGPGVGDWLDAPPSIGPEALDALSMPVAEGLRVLPRGHTHPAPQGRWADLVADLSRRPGVVVVDAGTGPVPTPLAEASDDVLLVLRPCFLAVTRAVATAAPCTGIVLVDEPGHTLGADEVTAALGRPVRTVVPWEPSVLRAVDAGLLRAPLPHRMSRAVRGAA